jgi:hypothetical protein
MAPLDGPASAVADGIHGVYRSTFESYWGTNSDVDYASIEWTHAEARYAHRDAIVATRRQAVGHLPYKIRSEIEATTVRLSQSDLKRPDGLLWDNLPPGVSEDQSLRPWMRFDPDERGYLGEAVVRFLRSMFEDLSVQTMLENVYTHRLPYETERATSTLTKRLSEAGTSAMEVELGVAERDLRGAGFDGSGRLGQTQFMTNTSSSTHYEMSYALAEAMCSLAYHHLATGFDS